MPLYNVFSTVAETCVKRGPWPHWSDCEERRQPAAKNLLICGPIFVGVFSAAFGRAFFLDGKMIALRCGIARSSSAFSS